ncbi:sce7726 family protein [Pedobacter gandavensis]|uniref:sce7726 family protein n=1 Tax=Pedobacter gandavensis TaxID=2679963 RepID=UPI00293049B7|nr:sce7726 family protein [Pedobacter gandavensis]
MKDLRFEQLGSSYNYALSQIFSTSLSSKIHSCNDEQKIRSLMTDCDLYPANEEWDLIKGLEIAYNYLKKYYRCEYIYKNEIANQILLQFHNDNSATLLREVSSDASIADIVIINGNTTAYEIKTELDSFERLSNQMNSYKSIYDQLYIVTHPGALKNVNNRIHGDVGIIIFDHDGILKLERQAQVQKNEFNPRKAVLTLRQSELMSAYQQYVGKLPKMGTALIYNFCYQWYVGLDSVDAHIIFAQALKSRRPSAHQFELIKKCIPALKMIFLSKEYSKKYCLTTMDKLCIFG